jgi:hypothetical protein
LCGKNSLHVAYADAYFLGAEILADKKEVEVYRIVQSLWKK